MATLNTKAEENAQLAEDLPAFQGIKLLHIKNELEHLLSLIGRGGIFDQYTRHDISHIDAMLGMLDWIIPSRTQSGMSPADWLMIVLSIYFHDLGLLVTPKEYKSRRQSGFPDYCENVLFHGDSGTDYEGKIASLPEEERERFLYQEFVRYKHAERIGAWITGKASDYLGVAHETITELDNLLRSLSTLFRRDLALVCESHHRDDLDNLRKYKIAQPYGNSDEETANLQYAAILLRTTDLLHITSDRTPSIVFRVINPTDPLSQEEWAKQMAVTRVKSKIGFDREGNQDRNAPRDSMEVHAYFTDENGFFGLTSYLKYVAKQLQQNHNWAQTANKSADAIHLYPWRDVDDSHVETQGFLSEQFEFTIDQAKILDLLTGHTLYNDTSVVLRELVQNALDATRLQRLIDPESHASKVEIQWDSENNILLVTDNGTGMTQRIIENHLLKVGASRYQDPGFIEEYPDFSPISRFGIGILSTFMIADVVEITTCSPDDSHARQISLRSVHGKYLIRLLDKHGDELDKRLLPHGTQFKLKIRASASQKDFDIEKIARKWIAFPGCSVTMQTDDNSPVQIGYSSPKVAIMEILRNLNLEVEDDNSNSRPRRIRVKQETRGGVTVAYAVEWADFWQEWSFLEWDNIGERVPEDLEILGTCIEGIRVEFETPGYDAKTIIAIANISGSNSPRTNVARSGIETTAEYDAVLKRIYDIYCDHVIAETAALHQNRSFSLTWAVQESRWLVYPILSQFVSYPHRGRKPAKNVELLISSLMDIPAILAERNVKRFAVSPKELTDAAEFWVIESALFKYAESLLRELPTSTSLTAILNSLELETSDIPEGLIVFNVDFSRFLESKSLVGKEIDEIRFIREQRRIDAHWVPINESPRGIVLDLDIGSDELYDREFMMRLYDSDDLIMGRSTESLQLVVENLKNLIIAENVSVSGLGDEEAIVVPGGLIYVVPNTLLGDYVKDAIQTAQQFSGISAWVNILYSLRACILENYLPRQLNNIIEALAMARFVQEEGIDTDELREVILHAQSKMVNPRRWIRESYSVF